MTTAVAGGRRALGQGSLGWLVLPALLFFTAFGILPLLAVIALSFTSWDGLGDITAAGVANWASVLVDPGLSHALWKIGRAHV